MVVWDRENSYQNCSVRREAETGDGGGVLVELAQAFFVGPVPDVDQAVRTASGEGVVLAVEGDCVDLGTKLLVLLIHCFPTSTPGPQVLYEKSN